MKELTLSIVFNYSRNDWLLSETKKKKRQKIWVSIGLALFAVIVIGGAVAYSVISRNPSVVMVSKN
jgi:hypothetical protein